MLGQRHSQIPGERLGSPLDVSSVRSTVTERVLNPHARVVLAVVQVLGKHDLAAERPGRLEDRGVPVGDPEPLPCGHGGEHYVDCRLLEGKAPERIDERSGLLGVRQSDRGRGALRS